VDPTRLGRVGRRYRLAPWVGGFEDGALRRSKAMAGRLVGSPVATVRQGPLLICQHPHVPRVSHWWRGQLAVGACAHLRRTHPSARPISVLERAESPAQS
jgi:hypothetical protein